MRIRRYIATILLGSLIGALFVTGTSQPVMALSVADYFSYTYSFTFSKTNIVGSEIFTVTVDGQAVCLQDVPIPVSSATLVSKVVARNTQTGMEFILNPNYSITYASGFPTQQGQTASASAQVPLSFPNGAPSGGYDITGQILEARITTILGITIDVAGYLPSTQTMGTVAYAPSNTGGGGGAVITTTSTTSTTITPSTTTTATTTTPTSSTPTSVISSSTPPTTTTPPPNLSPASFILSDLKVKPAAVVTGKTITVTVLLSNTGDLPGMYEVVMTVDGQIVNNQNIELDGNSSRSVTFTHLASIEGQHIITIGDLSKEFTVKASQPIASTLMWWLVGGVTGLVLGAIIAYSIIFTSKRKKVS